MNIIVDINTDRVPPRPPRVRGHATIMYKCRLLKKSDIGINYT